MIHLNKLAAGIMDYDLVWLSVDPLANEFPSWTQYNYVLNNPINLIDPDGKKPRIYIEGKGVGHAFVTVGSGKDLTVYTYGRYLGGGKSKPSSNSLDPSGRGVMIKLMGDEAQRYVDDQIQNKDARGYEFNDVEDADVASFFDNIMESGRQLTSEEANAYNSNESRYGSADDARVIDEYKLMSNNCATFCTDAMEAAGTSETFNNKKSSRRNTPLKATTPFSLELYLENQINNNSDNIIRPESQ